jgi:arylsulfatase A-like enzyme
MPFAERTLLVVFGDHGDEFDPVGKIGHGETLDDVVLHVPLAFYMPGRFTAGSYRFPVSLVDVAPTILDFLGKSGAFAVDGRSMLPLLTGEVKELAPRPVFAELQRAEGTCQEMHLQEDCFVGRFVAYTRRERFETSMIPAYQDLRLLDGAAAAGDAADIDDLQALLSAYVTGSPWDSQVPWRPRSVEVRRQQHPAIDDVTRQRLEALGYDF